MAKKYSQNTKDRMDESRGMKNYAAGMNKYAAGKNKMSRGFITGHQPEVGKGEFANLPQEKMMAPYPSNRARRGGYLDDSMAEIDAIQVDSNYQVESNLSHQK